MKFSFQNLYLFILGAFLFIATPAFSQIPEDTQKTESTEFDEDRPLDDIVEKRITLEKRVLPYQPIREADIFWEKRITRVIDVREKMNLPFAYPEMPFFSILVDAINNEEIRAFSTQDEKFSFQLNKDEVSSMLANIDTIVTFDPETYEEQIEVVRNTLDPEDIKRYRVKEIWFFDEETSTMQVRILGIAPLLDKLDDNGNFMYELPLFWVYYPECREILARHRVFNEDNDASPYTWEDVFEMRYFSSFVYKQNDVKSRRLQDYLSGVDLLLEADKIKQEIFNFEHDLWSY